MVALLAKHINDMLLNPEDEILTTHIFYGSPYLYITCQKDFPYLELFLNQRNAFKVTEM